MNSNLDSYQNGNKVIINGLIENTDTNSLIGKNLAYKIKSPTNDLLLTGTIAPNLNGSFSFETFAMDNFWKTDGNYVVEIMLGSIKGSILIFYDNTQFEIPDPVIAETAPDPVIAETAPDPVIAETAPDPVIAETAPDPVIAETAPDPVIAETAPDPVIAETAPDPVIAETAPDPVIAETAPDSNIICGIGTEDVNGICQVAKTEVNKSSKGGGCLIATAAYGSEMAPQVQLLREIRDNQLMNTESGKSFMGAFNEMYYSFSPTIADMQRENPYFKEIVKVGLTPMLSTLSLMENANSESEVLGLGLSVIALNLGMYIGLPAFGILKVIQLRKI